MIAAPLLPVIRRLTRGLTFPAGAWALLAMVLLIGGSACGGRAAASPTPGQPGLSADEVVRRSAESMKSLHSFRFSLSHPSGATVLPGGISLDAAVGAVVSPDTLQVTAEASFGPSFVKLSAVVIGEDTWVTNPFTGAWVKAPPGGSPFAAFDPGQLVADILEDVTEIRYSEGAAPVNGTYRIAATAGAPVLEPLVGTVDEARSVSFDLQIDAATFRLLRADIRGAVSEVEAADTVRVVELSDFDAAIDIKPPA